MKMMKWIMAALLLVAGAAQAASYTWDGGSPSSPAWGQANWSGDTPTFDDTADINFYAPGAARLTTFLGASRVIRSLNFTAAADSDVSIRTANLASGGTTNNASTLTFGGSGGAAITSDAGAAGNFTVGLDLGYINLAENLTITHNGTGALMFMRAVTNSFGITLNGSGLVILASPNTYSGATTVNAGDLRVNGSTVAASAVTVNAGAALSGVGTVGGATTLNAGAILAPGNLIADKDVYQLNFNNSLTLMAGSTNIIQITGTTNDVVHGTLTKTLVDAGNIIFDFTGFTGGVPTGYTLALSNVFTNWGTLDLSGATYSALGLAGDQSIEVSGGNLTVVPKRAVVKLIIISRSQSEEGGWAAF